MVIKTTVKIEGFSYMNKCSRDNDACTELLESNEDNVELLRKMLCKEDGCKDTCNNR